MDLPESVLDAMLAHARRCYPEEACGLLAFDQAGTLRTAYCLTNADHSSTAFTIDPDDHFGALTDAEARGWEIAGAFHSHPITAAEPSRTDIAGALDPRWVHVIIGHVEVASPQVRGWRIVGGRAAEEPLRVVAPVASSGEDGGACR